MEVRDSLLTSLNKEQKVEELEREMEAPDFYWDNAEASQMKMKQLKSLKVRY